ncbi:uncharacterized protein LOC126176304 [Schistocerca cancellata]|uniref:uncharacterized protein LOC126176304 n=1 Tax=Schistocerca cancellata TaxID=274614 RepID=UPI002118BA5C|nr:uncharacterized protein LOC126176304 [Schistocerca cancellata]
MLVQPPPKVRAVRHSQPQIGLLLRTGPATARAPAVRRREVVSGPNPASARPVFASLEAQLGCSRQLVDSRARGGGVSHGRWSPTALRCRPRAVGASRSAQLSSAQAQLPRRTGRVPLAARRNPIVTGREVTSASPGTGCSHPLFCVGASSSRQAAALSVATHHAVLARRPAVVSRNRHDLCVTRRPSRASNGGGGGGGGGGRAPAPDIGRTTRVASHRASPGLQEIRAARRPIAAAVMDGEWLAATGTSGVAR